MVFFLFFFLKKEDLMWVGWVIREIDERKRNCGLWWWVSGFEKEKKRERVFLSFSPLFLDGGDVFVFPEFFFLYVFCVMLKKVCVWDVILRV